jgi:hypothetical protein
MTPVAPGSGTVVLAVIEYDLFFGVSTQFSLTRIPGNSS